MFPLMYILGGKKLISIGDVADGSPKRTDIRNLLKANDTFRYDYLLLSINDNK